VSGEARVWHVSREYAGLAEAGGVKDVVRGLAEAQARAGSSPSVVLPLYGFMPKDLRAGAVVARFDLSLPDHDRGNAFFTEPVVVTALPRDGVRLLLVSSPRFDGLRNVYTYTAQDEAENKWKKRGTGHWDFHQMNLILQRAALETSLAIREIPDVFHCHDGHTAFLPALMREDPRYAAPFAGTGALVTIHNAGHGYHQEVWSPDFAALLTGLPPSILSHGLLNGTVDPFLLAGRYARLVTVSEQYARELLAEVENERAGGLGRALRDSGIPLGGITNGIDPRPYDPCDPASANLPFGFDPARGAWEGKERCRAALASGIGLSQGFPPGPQYAFVGRLTAQKGIDVLCAALESLLSGPARRSFVILGQGDAASEGILTELAARYGADGRLCFLPRYDPRLASLIYASSDFFLVPSAYEPCGLTDFIAQLMGSLPIVHRVGGLVKVRDGVTGFAYDEHAAAALSAAVERTTEMYATNREALRAMCRVAFDEIFALHTWDRVLADSYAPLYRELAVQGQWTRK
jgi:starch synthase